MGLLCEICFVKLDVCFYELCDEIEVIVCSYLEVGVLVIYFG